MRWARRGVAAIDSSLPVSQVRLMEDVLDAAQARPKFVTLLLALFLGVALAIATVGIYGVISFSVARRSKEFGLRVALGAQPGDVRSLVMKQGGVLVALGIVAGLAAAFALTRLMSSLLFGVAPTDPLTFASVTLILAAVALLACYIPARRATKVDPIQILRYEQPGSAARRSAAAWRPPALCKQLLACLVYIPGFQDWRWPAAARHIDHRAANSLCRGYILRKNRQQYWNNWSEQHVGNAIQRRL